MKLISIASAFPEQQYLQQDCLEAMQKADFWSELKSSSHKLLEKVLQADTGIEKRHLALDNLAEAWRRNAEELNNYYEAEAPKLAQQAAEKALTKTQVAISEVDALFICSCTGYLCPGLSSYVAERLGMRENAYLQDLTGLGCGAAIPMLEAAAGYAALYPDAKILTVAVEICSAAFYIEDDAGVLISTCIFGDGASAVLWSGNRGEQGSWQISNFDSIHCPESRELIRFTNAKGKLRNQLAKEVPQLAASVVKKLYDKRGKDTKEMITHGGGRDVILSLEKHLGIDELTYARKVMRHYGNLSSPSVLIALEMFLEESNDKDHLWLCTFGAGFSAHACELTKLKTVFSS